MAGLRPNEAKPDTENAPKWVKTKQECYETTMLQVSFHYFVFFLKP